MKILRTIYTLCAAALLFSSCQDEEMIKQSSVKEGIPVTIDLTFSAVVPKQETVGTRAERNPENNVNDLYVLIFNRRTRALKGGVHFFSGEDFINNQSYPTEETLEGTIDISTISGESVIYAIANVNNPPSEYSSQSDGQSLTEKIEAVKSISELEKITAELSAPSSSNALFRITDTHYIMSGFVECSIAASGNNNINIPLYRTDSKITFNIKAGTGTGSKCTNFTLLSYQVCKVAKKTALVPLAERQNYDTGSENTDNYWNTEAGIQPEETNTITFYVPENIKSAKSSTGAADTYAEREKWESEGDKGASADDRTFVTAPDNGTYVVLHGLFEGDVKTSQVWTNNVKMDGTLSARATVDYIIHLGDWTNDNLGTFSNKRNVEYIYTITVNGVDNIVVEVEKNEENEPGAEGDVFFQDGRFFNIDGHNVALLMEFKSAEINNPGLVEQNYFVARIRSPFGDGEISAENDDETVDDDWLLFSLNEKDGDGNYKRELRYYPGDPGSQQNSVADYENGKLMSLHELLKMLKAIKDKTEGNYADKVGDLVVTCYVKEYTYDDYGTYLGGGHAAPSGSTTWGDYTNQSNREAYIFGDIRDSKDENSSTIHTKYLISQRSIQTADEYEGYGDKDGVGLGIETFNETGDLPMGNPSKKPDNSKNGRQNMIDMLETGRSTNAGSSPGTDVGKEQMWGYYYGSNNELQYQFLPKYEYAAYACLLRNRDENGDGKIEGDEIKWFLPALDQYTAVYVGMDALSNESKLYSPTVTSYTNETLRHYFTGTWADDDPYIIWAEEGLSTQIFGSSTDDRYPSSANSGDYLTGKYRDYRCVRNLGGNDLEARTPFYTQNGKIFTINHQKNGVFRSKVTNASLDEHNQEDIENRVYRKFQVAQNYIDKDSDDDPLEEDMGEKTMNDEDDEPNNSDKDDWFTGEEVEEYDPCRRYYSETGAPVGSWRLPNQRELLVMMTAGIFKKDDFAYVIDDAEKKQNNEWLANEYDIPWDKVNIVRDPETMKVSKPRKKHVYKVFSATTFKFKNQEVPHRNNGTGGGQLKWRYYVQANGDDNDGVTDFIMQLQALDRLGNGNPNFDPTGDEKNKEYPSYGFVRCVRDVE